MHLLKTFSHNINSWLPFSLIHLTVTAGTPAEKHKEANYIFGNWTEMNATPGKRHIKMLNS